MSPIHAAIVELQRPHPSPSPPQSRGRGAEVGRDDTRKSPNHPQPGDQARRAR